MYTIKTNISTFYNSELEVFKDITSLLFHLVRNNKKLITKVTNKFFINIYKDGVLQEQYTLENIINDINTIISFKRHILDIGMVIESDIVVKKFNHYDYCLLYAEKSRIDKNFYKPIVVEKVFDNINFKKNTSLVFPLLFVKDKKTLSKIKLIQNVQPVLEINLNDYRLKIIK